MLFGCSDSSAEPTQEKSDIASQNTIAVTTVALDQSTGFQSQSVYTGIVEAVRSSDLAFEVGGTVVAVNVDEGDLIDAGVAIARLDQDRLNARKAEAEAGLHQAQAAAVLAESTLARLEEARSFDGVSAQQYDEANNAAISARAAVASAESRLNSAQVELSKTKLHALYPSVVLSRLVDEGQVVSPGQPIVRVQDAAAPEVRIGVAGDQVSELLVGQKIELQVNNQPRMASVKSISAIRDQITRTVDVVFTFDDQATQVDKVQSMSQQAATVTPSSQAKLRPGDLARLVLDRRVEAAGFWLPLSALTEGERGLWNAYILLGRAKPQQNATHEVATRAVELLYQDGQRAYVNGALKPGDKIISSGLNRVVPGQFVRIGSTISADSP